MAYRYIEQWQNIINLDQRDENSEQKIVSSIVEALDNGDLDFPKFVTGIASYVEDQDDLTVAGQNLDLLSRVLRNMKLEPSRIDTNTFVDYLCARLENASPGAFYISESLSAMSNWKRFVPNGPEAAISAIFKFGASNNFSTQIAITRLSCYQLVNALFTKHLALLRRKHSLHELVEGLVNMAVLEKNPSCLRELFKIYENISKEWELSADDYKMIFGSYSRYFPVSMREAPPDPSIPSTSELADLLLKCFISNDGYSAMTFNAMIERLDVDSANTKMAVFKTLESGAKAYSVTANSESASKIWDSLKFEIWNGDNDIFIQSSLNVLTALAASLDEPCDILNKEASLHKFVITCLGECKTRILDKEKTYLSSCGRIFHAIATASYHAFCLVSKFAIPVFDTLWQSHNDGIEKARVLEALNYILEARVQIEEFRPFENLAQLGEDNQRWTKSNRDRMIVTFKGFRGRLLEIYENDVRDLLTHPGLSNESENGLFAITGLGSLLAVPNYLEESERSMIIRLFIEVSLDQRLNVAVCAASSDNLAHVTTQSQQALRKVILPSIMERLPQKLSSDSQLQQSEIVSISAYITSIVRIVAKASPLSGDDRKLNFASMQQSLVDKIGEVLQFKDQAKYYHLLLAAGPLWFEWTEDARGDYSDSEVPTQGDFGGPIVELFRKVVQVKGEYIGIACDQAGVMKFDQQSIQLVGQYAMYALRHTSTNSSNSFLLNPEPVTVQSPIWTLFSSQGLDGPTTQPDLRFASSDKWLANVLSMYLLAGVKKADIKLLREKLDVKGAAVCMLRNSLTISDACTPFTRLACLWFLQLLINKFAATNDPLERDGSVLVAQMTEHIMDVTSGDINRLAVNHTFQTLAYFAAAALAALDSSTGPTIKLMLDNVCDPRFGRKVAQSFRILLAPSDIITKENSCTVRPLRKGRLYELAVKPLIGMWRTTTDQIAKENCLIALMGIINFLDPQMLANSGQELIPVFLEGTNILGDDFTKESSIKAILKVIPLIPGAIEEHLKSVLDRMTDRTHNTLVSPSDSNAHCRELALEVLTELTQHIRPSLLSRRKAPLMRELDFALEDCSREVRFKAERCKMAWFNMAEAE